MESTQYEITRYEVLAILRSIAPFFDRAEAIAEEVENGIPEELLNRLARILIESAESAESDIRAEGFSKAAEAVSEWKQNERLERSGDQTSADASINVDFP